MDRYTKDGRVAAAFHLCPYLRHGILLSCICHWGSAALVMGALHRYGGSGSGLVQALNRCLAAQEGAGEVVGVLAQLATVDEPRVSALLAAAFSSTLQVRARCGVAAGAFTLPHHPCCAPRSRPTYPTNQRMRVACSNVSCLAAAPQILVVRSYDCIKRLRGMLSAARCQVPSMLALGMAQVCCSYTWLVHVGARYRSGALRRAGSQEQP